MSSRAKAGGQRPKCAPPIKSDNVDESGEGEGVDVVKNHAGIKKISRRKSEDCSGKSRRKRSARRQLQFKSDGGINLTASLTTDLTTGRRDALLRFNSLSIDDQIALKLEGKKKAGDSVSSDSSAESDYEDKMPAPTTRPPLPRIVSGFDGHQDPTPDSLDMDDMVGNGLTASMRKGMEESKGTQFGELSSNSVNDFAVGIRTGRTMSDFKDKSKKQATDCYEERLRQKVLESSRSKYTSSKTETDFNQTLKSMQEARNWSCAKCTYVNKITSGACEMCKQPNDNRRHATDLLERPTLPGAYSVSKIETRSTTWQCKSCTYKDNKLGSVKCSICDLPRDGAVVSTVSEVPSTPGVYSVGGSNIPPAKTTISEWECKTCTFKHNKIISLACEVCQVPNQDRHSISINEQELHSGWQCSTCTYLNIDGMTNFCGGCGITRFRAV